MLDFCVVERRQHVISIAWHASYVEIEILQRGKLFLGLLMWLVLLHRLHLPYIVGQIDHGIRLLFEEIY